MRASLVLSVYVLAGTALGSPGCSGKTAERVPQRKPEAGGQALRGAPAPMVQFLFEREDAEVHYLDSALMTLQGLVSPVGQPLTGELRRLDSSATRRYLLAASVSDSELHGSVIRLYLLEPGLAAPVASSVLSPDLVNRFGIDTVADFDHDSALDVGYCLWPARSGLKGQWHALGFRNHHWYGIRVGEYSSRGCFAQPGP